MESNTSNNTSKEEFSKIFNNNTNKMIDNRITTSKTKINAIDEKLDSAKKRIKKLSDMQDTVNSIAKSMDRCIDLLSKSISGPKTYNKFNDMRNSNKLFLRRATASIEEESIAVRKKINELYIEKDAILRDSRNKYNQEEEKEAEIKKEKEEEKVVEDNTAEEEIQEEEKEPEVKEEVEEEKEKVNKR